MVDTIKFSQMPSGGDLANDEKTPGLFGGVNVLFNNPWTFLPPGTTAQRPAPSVTINYRLRFNTDDQVYEYYDAVAAVWTQLEQNVTTAGPFITYTADPTLPDAQNLGLLADGILKQSILAGVATLDIALPGIDYYPGASDIDLVNTYRTINALDPVLPQDYATKHYVDQNALNGTSVYAASAASLGTVTQSGSGVGATLTNAGVQAAFAIDGVNPPVGSNVLIKNTATGMTAANEGIYTVVDAGSGATNWSLVRASSYDTANEINNTGLIVIQNGSTLSGTAWYNTTTILVVDTTSFNYSQFGNIIFPINLAQGGTNAALTASNGGIVYSTATAMAILAGTATARQMLQSGASGAPAWSTATWPATTTINQLLYSSANNVVVGLASLANGVLVTDGSSVPSISTTLPNGITASGMLLTTPHITSGFLDANGNSMLGFNPSASAVNYLQIQNAATGNLPSIALIGSDTNITGNLFSKGTGGWNIQGVSDASNATTGFRGEYVSANVPAASAITLSTGVSANITSISLTAGDWDVFGNVDFQPSGVVSTLLGWCNTVSATAPDASNYCRLLTAAAANGIGFCVPMLRVSVSSTTTVYLSASSIFASGTTKVSGTIQARRVR